MKCTGALTRRSALAATGAALLSTSLTVSALSSPADAQGLSGLRNATRAVTESVRRSVRESLRIIRPELRIDRSRAGPVVSLHMDEDGDFLLVVLGDGSARMWDMKRGVQLGGAVGGGIVTGTVRGAGRASDALAIRRDGSSLSIRPDGAVRSIGGPIADIDQGAVPVLSADGRVLAFRISGGEWRAARDGRTEALPGAAPEARPILSRDGSRAIYRTVRGAPVVQDIAGQGANAAAQIGGCAGDTARVTAGAFTPDGMQAVLGDERGAVCIWSLPNGKPPRRLLVERGAHAGPVRALALTLDGKLVVTIGGDALKVWSVAGEIRRTAELEAGAAFGPLLFDAGRKWVLTGETGGTVGVHSLAENAEDARIARLISMDDGWAVVDREGRFDGPRSGIDSLVWADSENPEEALAVDAFSESWFEPGLLAKLDDASPVFLNQKPDDFEMSADGYRQPPTVSIDPVDGRSREAGERLTVAVRVAEENYQQSNLSEVRLYHNGKLTGRGVPGVDDGTFRHTVRLFPGENTFTAVGVGGRDHGMIEGPRSEERTVVARTEPRRSEMRIVGVGINDYDGPWAHLSYSRNDAVAVTAALRDRAGALFADVVTATLLDSYATAAAIEDRISGQPSSPRDVLVVFLAGHGTAQRAENGWEWYFIPYTDAWRGEMEPSDEALHRHGLSSRRLMDILTETAARRVFLVLDSCESGAVAKAMSIDGAAGRKALRRIARVGGLHVLAAAREDEGAAELATKKHGALTWLVLQGLAGQADKDRDGTVSVREIVDYAAREMPSLSERLGEAVQERPVDYSRGVDFALAGP